MAIDARTMKLLWGKAGATCAFPGCRRPLVQEATPEDREAIVGEVAHIVAQQPTGPRGASAAPDEAIDGYSNLILLCHAHHEIIDQQPNTYTVERLLQMKKDHEEWVRQRLSIDHKYQGLQRGDKLVTENVFSTVLPVSQLPHYVYSGECSAGERDVQSAMRWPDDKRIFTPFIVRGGRLFTFCDLTSLDSPFAVTVDPGGAKREMATAWFDKPELFRWYIELLNRLLNKITGRLGLRLDKVHHRYYFEPDEPGKEKRVSYQTVGGIRSERAVAWNPHFKHDDSPKRYWEHLAVGLRFRRLGKSCWGLALRPERRFTQDGFIPLDSSVVGKKNTKRKSRMYNFDVLQELQFWRDFLSQRKPRIACFFGRQALVIENKLLGGSITWPQISADVANRMAAMYEDDLFTLADLEEAENLNDEFDSASEEIELDDSADDYDGTANEGQTKNEAHDL